MHSRTAGNLALSRAIGDFEFKNNHALSAEQQIVTADPEIHTHELGDDEEFLILACDGMTLLPIILLIHSLPLGIWDCLTSQQAVDMVRRQIAQKKPLQEICEVTIQKCCAPDADTGAGIGCDNMTMIVVALLNGRTLDQWYDWVADRVEQKVGYETPEDLPQVFSESRILAAQQRAQYRNNSAFGPAGSINLRGPAGFGALARVLGGGISFNPTSRTTNDPNVLSFAHDDDDDDYEDDDDDDETGDTGEGGLFGVNRLKVGNADGKDKTNALRNQLEELDSEMYHDHPDGSGVLNITEVDDDDEEMKEALPRAHITLPSPSEKQGMINLDAVQDETMSGPTVGLSPHESGFANNGKTWVKVSTPTVRSEVSSVGSPLVPIPLPLKAFGKHSPSPSADDATPDRTTLTPKLEEALPTPGAIAEAKVPPQDTGRVPDGDAKAEPGGGLTNGLLDKSEDPIKA